jgi:hypothetical protein
MSKNFDPLTWTAGTMAEPGPPVESTSTKLLREASTAISKDRMVAYGNCGPSSERVSILWNAWMEVTGHTSLTPEDVAMMMALFKAARIAYNPNSRDSYVDMIGYVALAGEMSLRTEDPK